MSVRTSRTPAAPRRTRPRLGALAALAALALPLSPAAQEPAARDEEPPTFRTGIELVSLTVTVTDRHQNYVTDLDHDELLVYEDGVKQDLSFFSRRQTPTSLAILIDTSASMEPRMAFAQEAAIGFVEHMGPDDMAAIIDFNNRVNVLETFTRDKENLRRAIRQTRADGPTSLYNAVYIALRELEKVESPSIDDLRRQAIVVLTDGEDTASLVSFEEVLDLAKRSDVAIYTIGLRSREAVSYRGFNEADFVLRQFAQETGARAFFPQAASQLAGIYGEIASELASQYVVGYASSNPLRDGRWRRVVVQVLRPDAMARAKMGYYGPGQ